MFGVVLGLALAAADPARTRALPLWTDRLDSMGWPFLSADPSRTIVLFAKVDANSAPGGYARVLVRHEFATPQTDRSPGSDAGPFFSERILEEVDCSTGRFRALEAWRFREPNLTGKVSRYGFADQAWKPPEPGSFDQTVGRAECMRPPSEAASASATTP